MATIDNNVQEDYCSLEVSKLLKEKGFEVPTFQYHRITNSSMLHVDRIKPVNWNDDSKMETAGGMTYVSAPTHALAIKWIKKNFKLWVYVDYSIIHKWFYSINDLNDNGRVDETKFDSPEGATEAALLYALKNFIP